MKTEEEYFKDAYEEEKKEAEERKLKWRNDILEKISEWDFEKLKEEYVKSDLARIRYHNPITVGFIWDTFKDECRFCSLEYIYGHETCCDDCWDKNKGKTLAELE